MILAFLIASQVSFAGLDEDRKLFEPYRQCILQHARELYPTRQTLRMILLSAQLSCIDEETKVVTAISLSADHRKPDSVGRPADAGERIRLFNDQLFLELANEFVPKENVNAASH